MVRNGVEHRNSDTFEYHHPNTFAGIHLGEFSCDATLLGILLLDVVGRGYESHLYVVRNRNARTHQSIEEQSNNTLSHSECVQPKPLALVEVCCGCCYCAGGIWGYSPNRLPQYL